MPCNSEYPSCLADMVPVRKLEHGGERDKGVNISNTERGGLAEDVQNRETRKEGRAEDKHEAKQKTAN